MPAVAAVAVRFLVSYVGFLALEKVISAIIDKNDDSILDTFLALLLSTIGFKKISPAKLRAFIKTIPQPQRVVNGRTVQTADDVALYLDDIMKKGDGFMKMNQKLGGYYPLAISLMTKMQNMLTVKGTLKIGAAGAFISFLSWLVWAPSQLQNWMDQGVFAPEQANEIFKALGIPYRWPISETRQTQTALEESKLDYYQGRSSGVTGVTGYSGGGTMTIIRMSQEMEQKQFVGTLFSAKLGKADHYERKVNDEIDDMDELRDDAQLALGRWLSSLPNRMGYSINIVKDPVDEYGARQSGIWATLTLFVTHISGKTTPIDSLLLGPVTPKARIELGKMKKDIEGELPQSLTAQTVREITIPSGSVDIFNEAGDRAFPSTPFSETSPAVSAPAPDVDDEPETVANEDEQKELKAQLEEKLEDLKDELNSRFKKGDVLVTNTPGSRLNLRSRGDTRSDIRAKIPHNTKLEVLSDGVREGQGGYFAHVLFDEGSRKVMGYVSVSFVRKG